MGDRRTCVNLFWVPLSESACLVNYVAHGLSGCKAVDVVEQRLQMTLRNAWRGGGAVGRDEDVFHAPQRMIGRQGLDLEDVEPGARDVAGLQRRGQIGEVDDDAAADV